MIVNIEPPDKCDRAFCAGFFEGRGSISFKKSRNNRLPRINFEITSKGREVLDTFAEKMGVGTVRGPYLKQGAKVYVYNVSDRAKVLHIINSLWPWLGPQRRAQINHVLETYAKVIK